MDKRLKLAMQRTTNQDKQKNFAVRVIQLAEAHNDPPIREVKSNRGDEFVLYGDANDYYDNIILRYLGSPTNSRCINGISDMIYGRGLDATDSTDKPLAYTEMKRLFNGHDVRRVAGDLKMLGQGTAQVIYNKTKTKILKFVHTPTECWRAAKAKDGVIGGYYYHPKWADYKRGDKLKFVPTFGNGDKKELVELYIFRPYKPGFYYYSPVDYHGCLQYCELEEEVSQYHIHNIQNGLQPSMLINFNNGVPPEENQELIERKIGEKFGGATGQKFILAFNDDSDSAAEIVPIHLPDAHAQYQFLADESREKIMLGHGVVSPILLGIKDNTGFGNNAEELRTSSILMDNMVIRPFQHIMIDGIKDILDFNGMHLKPYFVTLQPIEFTDVEKIATKIRREEETGEKLSSHVEELTADEEEDLLAQLEGLGETISDEWELIYTKRVEDGTEGFKMTDLASEANPDQASKQDQGALKVRYAYMPITDNPKSRRFCKHILGFTRANIVFRKEDIDMMSFRGANRELGHKRQNYSILKFKGGKNCQHFWQLRVYRKRVSEDNRTGTSEIQDPGNPSEVPIRPVDMPGRGAHPSTLK